MEKLAQALLSLDRMYVRESFCTYEQARERLEIRIEHVLPGFTIAYALKIGTVGSGKRTYQHGGVAHVLFPRTK